MVKRRAPNVDVEDCPECGGDVETERGETACVDCGLLLDEQQIDHGLESPYRERHRGQARTFTRHDSGLGTANLGHVDYAGRNVESFQLSRLRTQNSRARFDSKSDRNLAYGLAEVGRMAAALGQAKSVTESASAILRRAQDEGLFWGRSIEAMAAGSLVAALRIAGIPHGTRDVHGVARVEHTAVKNAYNVLNRDLGLPTPPPTITSHVPPIASAVDLPDELRRDAEAVAHRLDERGALGGRSPAGAAAAVVYLVAVERGGTFPGISQAQLASAADCSTATIRNSLRAIEESDLGLD